EPARIGLKENQRRSEKEQGARVKPSLPYCLRHTALTNLASAGCDAFTLALAGQGVPRPRHSQDQSPDRGHIGRTSQRRPVLSSSHQFRSTRTSSLIQRCGAYKPSAQNSISLPFCGGGLSTTYATLGAAE